MREIDGLTQGMLMAMRAFRHVPKFFVNIIQPVYEDDRLVSFDVIVNLPIGNLSLTVNTEDITWVVTDEDWIVVGAIVLMKIILASKTPLIDLEEARRKLGSGDQERRIR